MAKLLQWQNHNPKLLMAMAKNLETHYTVLSVCRQRLLDRAGDPQPHAFSFSPFSDLRARRDDALCLSVRPSSTGRTSSDHCESRTSVEESWFFNFNDSQKSMEM
nr:hypothetical protein Iba_chr08aCG9340 [Ipomoea batatas]